MATLYRNGRIYSSGSPDPSAMVVDDGIITWIGQEDGIGQHAGVEEVDLADAFVTPAFVDAHVHATGTGIALAGLELGEARSLAEALELLDRAARASRGRPILGGGWDETRWPEQRPPTAAELDRASYGGSVYLARVDAHSAVVSSSLAAVVPGLAAMPGNRGQGWVTGAAHDAVRTAALGALTPGQTRDLQLIALQASAAQGIACVHEMAGPAISSEADLLGLFELARTEAVPEVIGYWGELHGIETARRLGAVGAAGDLFCDGSLGSHTAALHHPYADEPDHSGALRFETTELAEHIRACIDAGLQAGFHAIGDAAIDQILDALDLVSAALGRPAGAGQRLEHAELVSDPARLAASGLLASMQPAFDAAWGGPGGMYADRLGAERAAGMNRFAELAAAGVPLAFGSDSPVTPLDPWGAVRAAAYPHEPGAAISVRAAFAAHTRAGWRAGRRDNEGVLAPGLPATFAVWRAGGLGIDAPDERVARWSTDPRANIPGLPDVSPGTPLPTCMRTVLRGRTIYDIAAD
ncbi:amidohydrolase family protein [Jatrophihabitans sp.]|uniref:amidohydrolase n=1 Tax=Jatrophihabitans sp. TaxID=1932789 RepID=UPI0030C7623B|nr:nfdA 1 [Jatrophihabitans sp.]